MTRDDIDDLMRDNNIVVVGEAVYALCQIVAAAEREKVARWMTERGYATGHGDSTEDLLQELEWQIAENLNRAITTEREARAKVQEFVCSTGFCRFTLTQTNVGLGEVKKRGWVGLTDEEVYQAESGCWFLDEFDKTLFARAIEAKLKEKNGQQVFVKILGKEKPPEG